MHGQAQFPSSVFRTISLAIIAASVVAVTIVPTWAQNTVPPTAVQTAKMPEFASRLAHPGKAHAAPKSSVLARTKGYFRPLQGNDIYDNGPINGTTDAWTINFGYITSDSFTVTQGNGTPITGMSFGAWLVEGDTLESAQLSITSGENGGTSYFNQTLNFTQSACSANQYSYNVCTETSSSFNVSLNNGTYWVNLQNATTADGEPIYWDENSGVGCTSPGCPSSASQSSVGTIPSESFTINPGSSSPNSCMPEQSGNFRVIHDFTAGPDGYAYPSGVAIDSAGNLYGAALSSEFGTIFKLANAGSNWLLSTLYNFTGSNDGSYPGGVIVGKDEILYGGAGGGTGNCNFGDCGLIFGVKPAPNACQSLPCAWTENVLYEFTGDTDAYDGGGLVSDPAGNLYGLSQYGGAWQNGAVFELVPSPGGWQEKILYSFTGGSDGAVPLTIVFGNDGNIYGNTAGGGGSRDNGVVFQLTPSAGSWTETVLYDIPNYDYTIGIPNSLVQTPAGDLIATFQYFVINGWDENYYGRIFELSPSNGQWIYSTLLDGYNPNYNVWIFNNLAIDSTGNFLYGTGTGIANEDQDPIYYGFIFRATPTGSGWNFGFPVLWSNTYFPASGALAVDSHGNLFGTTTNCGLHSDGTVWELSP